MTAGPGRPSLAELQLAPPSALLKTPLPRVAAYKVRGFCGSITTAEIEPPSGPRLVHCWDLAKAAPLAGTAAIGAEDCAIAIVPPIAQASRNGGIPSLLRFEGGSFPLIIQVD